MMAGIWMRIKTVVWLVYIFMGYSFQRMYTYGQKEL